MGKLQKGWEKYAKACYPNGINGVQLNETHQAFMAGSLVMFLCMMDVNSMDEGAAMLEIARLEKEATEAMAARAAHLTKRN